MSLARKIENPMVLWLDHKLKENGIAQYAIRHGQARTLFICAVEACVGIRESGGNNNGPLVRLIQETVGTAVREPWCMSFIQTCIAYVEIKLGIKSPIAVSELVTYVWEYTPKSQRVKFLPARGAIPCWRYKGTSKGHTGAVVEVEDNTFLCVEGNTNSGMNSKEKIVREGGGVYLKRRSLQSDREMELLGFLKPFNF